MRNLEILNRLSSLPDRQVRHRLSETLQLIEPRLLSICATFRSLTSKTWGFQTWCGQTLIAIFSRHHWFFLVIALGTAPPAAAFTHFTVVTLKLQTISSLAFSIFITSWCGFSAASIWILDKSSEERIQFFPQPSTISRCWLAILWLLSLGTQCFIALKIYPWNLGDGASHAQILSSLQLPGPFSMSPFEHVGVPGPPYPQAFHLLILLLAIPFGNEFVTPITQIVIGIYGSFVLPFVLYLYAKTSLKQSLPERWMLPISLVFSSALTFDIAHGTFPTMMVIPIGLLVASLIASSQARWLKITVFLISSFLMLGIHPLGIPSLVLLINWKRFWGGLFGVGVLLLLTRTTYSYFPYSDSFFDRLLTSQVNFSAETSLWTIINGAGSTVSRLLTFEGPILGLNTVAGFVGWYVLGLSLSRRDYFTIRTFIVTALLLTTYLSGLPGVVGQLASIPTLLWYSTPVRFIHVPISLVFLCVANWLSVHQKNREHLSIRQPWTLESPAIVSLVPTALVLLWNLSLVSRWLD